MDFNFLNFTFAKNIKAVNAFILQHVCLLHFAADIAHLVQFEFCLCLSQVGPAGEFMGLTACSAKDVLTFLMMS